jgi:hypothetical protein
MNLVRRIARFLHPIGAAAIVFLVFVQVYLIADYIFGNAGVLNTHEVIGRVVVGIELIVLITALIGWWRNWAQIGASAALFLIGACRPSLRRTSATRRRCTPSTACSPSRCSRSLVDPRSDARRRPHARRSLIDRLEERQHALGEQRRRPSVI